MADLVRDLRAYVDRLAELAEHSVAPPALPARDEPGAIDVSPPADHGRRPGRRARFVVATVAVAAALVAIVTVVARPEHDRGPTTRLEGRVEVEGPSGSRWFVLDLPGLTPRLSSRQTAWADPAVTLQTFRTDAGLAGPAVWVASNPNSEGFLGLDETDPGVGGTTVQGAPALVSDRGDVVELSWPRSEADVRVTAVHLPVGDVVAFAEGLRLAAGGDGVDATALPRGLVEQVSDGPWSYRSETAVWSYSRPGHSYTVLVATGRMPGFERSLWGALMGGGRVEELSVDGRPGLMVAGRGDDSSVAVWRPTGSEVAQLRVNGPRAELLTALEALDPVNESTWREQFP